MIDRDNMPEGLVRVSYEDMSNPRREGIVVERKGDQFRVLWDDNQYFTDEEVERQTWSDLRQSGWNIVLS